MKIKLFNITPLSYFTSAKSVSKLKFYFSNSTQPSLFIFMRYRSDSLKCQYKIWMIGSYISKYNPWLATIKRYTNWWNKWTFPYLASRLSTLTSSPTWAHHSEAVLKHGAPRLPASNTTFEMEKGWTKNFFLLAGEIVELKKGGGQRKKKKYGSARLVDAR